MSRESDLENRKKDAWFDVELFRLVHNRLPTNPQDDVTKMTAKRYLDKFVWGGEKIESTIPQADMNYFAFHVYASTNLAYTNDLPKKAQDA